jgi:hypothetical protein
MGTMETAKQRYSLVPPLVVVITAVVAVIATFLVPVASKAANPWASHWRAAASTATTVLLLGAAIIYLRGLKSFKAEMRSAYRSLAISFLLFSLLFVQLIIWGIGDMWDSVWATSGSGLLPFIFTIAFIHVAVRKFARLLNVHSIFSKVWFVVLLTIIASGAMGVFAHYYVKYDIDGTDLYIGTCAGIAVYFMCTAILLFKVLRVIGTYYQQAMRWLFINLIALSLGAWHEAINTLWFNNGSTYTDYGYYLIPWVVNGFISLFAAYQFRSLTAFGAVEDVPVAAATDRDYIDSIVSVAGLASRRQDVDPILDDLRGVTASLKPGMSLSADDKQRLMDTYKRLELYLQQKDPARTFSSDEILSQATPAFRRLVNGKQPEPAAAAAPQQQSV